MESLCRGTSRMDAARGLMGHGWPFQAGPRNNDVARKPQRSWGRMSGLDLLVSLGRCQKKPARQSGIERKSNAITMANHCSSMCSELSRKLEAKASPTIALLTVRFCLEAVSLMSPKRS